MWEEDVITAVATPRAKFAPVHYPPTATPESVPLAFALGADVTTTAAILSEVAVPKWLPLSMFPP